MIRPLIYLAARKVNEAGIKLKLENGMHETAFSYGRSYGKRHGYFLRSLLRSQMPPMSIYWNEDNFIINFPQKLWEELDGPEFFVESFNLFAIRVKIGKGQLTPIYQLRES